MILLYHKIEAVFETLAKVIISNRILSIMAALTVATFFCLHIPDLEMDMSTEGFLRKDDPTRVVYNNFRNQFGNDNVIILVIESTSLFSDQTLRTLKSLHHDLEMEVPFLDEVKSLINARNTYGTGDTLVVEDLLEGWPDAPRDLAHVRKRAMGSPLYRNMYLNEAGSIMAVVIKPVVTPSKMGDDVLSEFDAGQNASGDAPRYITPLQTSEIMAAIRTVTKRYDSQTFRIHVAGWPVVETALVGIIKKDSSTFLIISTGVCALLLLCLFRRGEPVILSLLVVGLSFFSTLGLMAWLGIAYKLPSQILPVFMTVVGIGDSVHLQALFFRNLRSGMSREQSLVKALGYSGAGILLTSLTTAGGLLSFMSGENAPMAELGLYAASGIMLAFFYSVVLLPALMALLPLRPPKKLLDQSKLDNALASVGRFACNHPARVVVTAAALLLVSAYGVTQATYSHHPTRWLPSDMSERLATEFVDSHMSGSRNLEIVVDTHNAGGVYDPALLERLNVLARGLEERFPSSGEGIFIGKTLSVVDVIKEINQALNGNSDDAYVIPKDARLVAQEFLLFENSGTDDLEDFVDTKFSKARFTIRVPDMDCTSYDAFIGSVKAMFRSALGPDVTIEATGVVGLTSHILTTVKQTQVSSLFLAVGIISLLMIILVGNIRIGPLSMIPNVIPIIGGVGAMGLAGIPFDNATASVTTVALGIAVDGSIHFLYNFRRYYENGNNVVHAVEESMRTTGRALLFTSLVLVFGFMSYSFATLKSYVNFGLLLSLIMLLALLANLVLCPALLAFLLGGRRDFEKILENEQCV